MYELDSLCLFLEYCFIVLQYSLHKRLILCLQIRESDSQLLWKKLQQFLQENAVILTKNYVGMFHITSSARPTLVCVEQRAENQSKIRSFCYRTEVNQSQTCSIQS